MQRKLPDLKNVSALLTADWHLRDTVPTCRTDDFWIAQWKKVAFVRELAERYDCPVLHAGDLLDHWRSSPLLLSTAINQMPPKFWTVMGNHDLPQHNLEQSVKSGIRTLEAAEAINILPGCHMGQTPTRDHMLWIANRPVLVWHEGVWKGEKPWPNCTALQAIEVLEQFPDFDLIVTGDFHTPCIEKLEGRLLVNPGSLMRQTADQIDFKPRVYAWNAEENKATPIYLPIDPDAVSRDHLNKVKDRDTRIEAFVARLQGQWTVDLNFEDNIKRFMTENELDARTQEIILKAIA